MNKIITIVDKEWAEVFKNRIVLFTVVLLPFLFSIMPLVVLYSIDAAGPGARTSQMPPNFERICSDLTGVACVQVVIVYQFMMLFMVIPIAIPAAISSYSIVGEKTNRSLEPLLATPISTTELILGKCLASVIPAVIGTWAAFCVFLVGARILISTPGVFERLADPMWLMAVVILGPLIAVASVSISIMISSRVSDPRTAEQLSMVLMVPLLMVFFSQIGGLIMLDVRFVVVASLVMVLADAFLLRVGTRLFQRETILTRWS
jgi:ABC-2 type transport system permease protein